MSTKLWGFSCFLIRNMFGSLVVYLTHLAPYVHFSCIEHSHFLHTPLLPLSCIGLYLIFSSQNVMFTLCFVALCFVLGLSFIFSFISHLLCIIIIVRSFISCPRFSLTLCLFLTKRGRVYSREYTRVFCHFFMTLVHIFKGRNSISHAHLQGERYSIGEMHIPRGRRHCVNQKTLFCLFSCRLYGALSYVEYLCFVVLIASCLCVGHAYILMLLCFIECMFGGSFTLLCDHCSHFYMTILVYD